MTNRAANRIARLAAAFAAGALVLGSVAPAQAVGSDPKTGMAGVTAGTNGGSQTASVSPENDKNRYCVKQQASTGTIIDRKVCKTRMEWIKSTGIDPVTIAR